MDGGVPQRVYMSCGGFIPPMVRACTMHGPSSAPSQYSSAFEFPVLVLVTTTLTYNMAASSADFEWFNDVDDEHPIGKCNDYNGFWDLTWLLSGGGSKDSQLFRQQCCKVIYTSK